MNMNLPHTPLAVLLLIIAVLGGFMLWSNTRATSSDDTVVDARGQSEVSIVLSENGFEPRYLRDYAMVNLKINIIVGVNL